MKLSEINPTPLYDIVIPSTQKRTKFRPFFVKEERALLAAYESEDVSVMLNTLSSVVKNCLQGEKKELTTFDIEYAFLQIRSKSVGEFTLLNFHCVECEKTTPMNVDIRRAEVKGLTKNTNIVLSDSLSVKMRYPTLEQLVELETTESSELLQHVLISSIEAIYIDSECLKVEEEPVEELIAFAERLTTKQYQLLEEFILSAPTVELNFDWNCPHCKHKNTTQLRGINSFF